MNDQTPHRRRTLESLRKEAKHWLKALRAADPDARARFDRAIPDAPAIPTLRDVQHALAREQGLAGWTALRQALAADAVAGPASAKSLADYEAMAEALLDAYRTGTPEALERHYRHTWHRRSWEGLRTYIQLDLGKRPTGPDDDVEITLDDARYLVAVGHGFGSWEALKTFVMTGLAGPRVAARPVRLVGSTGASEASRTIVQSREWDEILRHLAVHPTARLEASGTMTDTMLAEVSRVEGLTSLNLGGSKELTDDGIRHLARLPRLRHLDVSGTAITDRGLAVLRDLPALETLALGMTRITDEGVAHLAHCHELQEVNLIWTHTGDGALRALAGKQKLRTFASGMGVTDDGIPLLHELPVFKRWHGGEPKMALLSYSSEPNHVMLRGPFTDRGLQQMRGLDGLFGLNLDDANLAITAAAMEPLASLPNLGWLAVDAKDDWMPFIAEMPRLRFLGVQDTVAGDDGFEALGRSQSIEYIWGRRCHNLRRRGFMALAQMPALRGLSVSCLNVDDVGVSALPAFPALRELMPMDIPDAGYRHIGRCEPLESLVLMYCRDTTDAATEHITGLRNLTYYFTSYTTITDRTPALLSTMDSLERITFDTCHGLTNAGIAHLARLPALRELRASGRGLTPAVTEAFPPRIRVFYGG
jgi:hypothetical protein